MANEPLDTGKTGQAATLARATIRTAVWGWTEPRPDEAHDADVVARVAVEALRAAPGVLAAFAAEVIGSALADGGAGLFHRTIPVYLARCSWCGTYTIVSPIMWRSTEGEHRTGFDACGTCVTTNRVCQPPTGHTAPWPPSTE